jgi:hypothetical protein
MGDLLWMDANLNPYWSHALDQLAIQFIAWPQTSPFCPHPSHPCERLTNNDDINMLDSSPICTLNNMLIFLTNLLHI